MNRRKNNKLPAKAKPGIIYIQIEHCFFVSNIECCYESKLPNSMLETNNCLPRCIIELCSWCSRKCLEENGARFYRWWWMTVVVGDLGCPSENCGCYCVSRGGLVTRNRGEGWRDFDGDQRKWWWLPGLILVRIYERMASDLGGFCGVGFVGDGGGDSEWGRRCDLHGEEEWCCGGWVWQRL